MTSAQVLRESTEQRIRNQIGRVFRGTFGAEQGLCTLVELATLQMRGNGLSRTAIHDVLARLVTDHPDACHGSSASASDARARTLAANVVRWSDGTRGARVSA
jgi:hypothetical protein